MGKNKATPRLYGRAWASKGTAEDITCCIEEVSDKYSSHQCYRKRGFGKDGLYCKQHNPVAVARKEKVKLDKWNKEFESECRAATTRQKRDKLARELAVIVINQCSGGMGSPMLTKARQLLKLYSPKGSSRARK